MGVRIWVEERVSVEVRVTGTGTYGLLLGLRFPMASDSSGTGMSAWRCAEPLTSSGLLA